MSSEVHYQQRSGLVTSTTTHANDGKLSQKASATKESHPTTWIESRQKTKTWYRHTIKFMHICSHIAMYCVMNFNAMHNGKGVVNPLEATFIYEFKTGTN